MKIPHSLLILTLATFSVALNEELARETRCFETKTDPNINLGWVMSVQKWYFPLWSKLELYRVASDILEKPISEIPLSGFIESACVVCSAEYECTGFNHPPVVLGFDVDASGVYSFKAANHSGIHTLVLTDNKNYIVGISCWDDDETTYIIWTPKPTISNDDKTTIQKYLKKLGLNMDYMVSTPYDHCQLENHPSKNEL